MALYISHTTKKIKSKIKPVSSKSISNRALIIEALCDGEVHLENLSAARDTQQLKKILSKDQRVVNVGEGGTTFRFYVAYLATRDGEWEVHGEGRMNQRPVHHLVEALNTLGADITYLEKPGYPPLKINGGGIRGGRLKVSSTVSSQFASALCLIAPVLPNGLEMKVEHIPSRPYLEMTLSLMELFGIEAHKQGEWIKIAPQPYHGFPYLVEGDWSAAAPFFACVALAEEAELELQGLQFNSIQGDAIIAEFMELLGVQTFYHGDSVLLLKSNKMRKHPRWHLYDHPDLAPTLVTTCAALQVPAAFQGIDHLIYKESDRLKALQNEMRNIHCEFEKSGDEWLLQPGHLPLKGEFITYNDHRIAMAVAPLALKMDEVAIHQPEVVRKSYPTFWEDMEKVGFSCTREE